MIPRTFRSLVVLALAACLTATACGRYVTAYAAVVNGVTISFDDLERAVIAARAQQQQPQQQQGPAPIELQRQVLVQLIQRLLVDDQLRKLRVTVTDADLDARIRQVRNLFSSEDEFTRALQSQGLDVAKLRDRLGEQVRIEKLQRAVVPVTVTDAEVAAAYRSRRGEFTQVHARHILFSTQTRSAAAALAAARDAVARIRGGADFAALAKSLSDDPGSKPSGGDLGTQAANGYVEPFAKAVTTLPLKRASDPVKTDFGYHVIEVLSRTVRPFAAVRDQLRSELFDRKVQGPFQQYLQVVVARSSIEVNPRIGDLDPASFQILDHRFFVPSSPEAEPGSGDQGTQPLLPQPAPIAPGG